MIKCSRCEGTFLSKNDYVEHEPSCIRKEKVRLSAQKAMEKHHNAFRRLAKS